MARDAGKRDRLDQVLGRLLEVKWAEQGQVLSKALGICGILNSEK